MIVALAGGVGGARFLRGLVHVVDADTITIIGNTGDDEIFHGLHVSPDLDTVTYTLAGAANAKTGWGLAGETFEANRSLARYGVPTWFNLGDRDLATHIFRTQRLAAGATLSEVTAEIAAAWGLQVQFIPMSDDRVATKLVLTEAEGIGELSMQEWFVGQRCEPEVASVRYDGAEKASPAPGVLEAITGADAIVIAPSNPILSIDPILSIPGIREALVSRRDHVVAISPIVAGAAIRGPAAKLLETLGDEASCVGVARRYADICATIVIDTLDADRADEISAQGIEPVVANTMMTDAGIATNLARVALGSLRTSAQ